MRWQDVLINGASIFLALPKSARGILDVGSRVRRHVRRTIGDKAFLILKYLICICTYFVSLKEDNSWVIKIVNLVQLVWLSG